MTDLAKIQQNFAKHIYKKSDKKILNETIHSDIEALERLNIYRNNVLGNFESILSSIFIVTKKIIGDKKFDELTQKFCQKFPSKSGDLNEFGTEFPQFIKSCEPKYLKDLAQLELFYHQSYFAAKPKKEFDLDKFKKIKAEDFSKIIFTLNPSCILLASKFAIFSIWQKEQKIKNFAKPEFTAIHSNKILSLSAEEFLFLSLILQKKPLYKIYESLCKKSKKEIDIGALINRFIADGTIIKFAL